MVDGVDLATLDEDGLALFRRDQVGILFQSFHLIPTLTAQENVALPVELKGVPRAEVAAAGRARRGGPGARLRHYPAQLSGGEQQRVALARALVEPAAPPARRRADRQSRRRDRAGRRRPDVPRPGRARMTLLLITHDARLAERCERRLTLDEGRAREPGGRAGARAGARLMPGVLGLGFALGRRCATCAAPRAASSSSSPASRSAWR